MVKYTVTIDLRPASSTGLHESFPYIPTITLLILCFHILMQLCRSKSFALISLQNIGGVGVCP